MIGMTNAGGSGTGCTLTITAPAGAAITVANKAGKVKSKTVGANGLVVFRGLTEGTWTITITHGTDTASKTVEIKADYQAEITFFSATINITYPAGLTCTATDGVTTLTAPDTSGTWACVVDNAGPWTVALSNGLTETVTVADQGAATIDKWYLLKNGVANQHYKFGEGQLRADVVVAVTSGEGTLVCDGRKNETAGVATTIPLNLAGFTKMSVAYSGNRNIYFSGYTKLGMTYSEIQKPPLGVKTTSTSGTADVDISADSGDWYIGVGWPSGSSAATVSISNLWLEV